jgi:UDP-N-acetylmuramoylalanine--D-glutamate ligase
VEEYRNAKLRIFENQTPEDFAVVNALSDLPPLAAKRITFSAHTGDADFSLRGTEIIFEGHRLIDQRDTNLPGVHNAENLMAAFAMGLSFGVDLARLAEAVGDYSPPAHRCEFVRDLDGVRWINDSKATNLDSVEKAILSQDRPIVLIAGGKDKGFEFDDLHALVKERVKSAVLIGEMRERIRKSWPGVETRLCASLEEAVQTASNISEAGDVVLFSPGTSSFDMFRNYGERGNLFKQAVTALNTIPKSPTTKNQK